MRSLDIFDLLNSPALPPVVLSSSISSYSSFSSSSIPPDNNPKITEVEMKESSFPSAVKEEMKAQSQCGYTSPYECNNSTLTSTSTAINQEENNRTSSSNPNAPLPSDESNSSPPLPITSYPSSSSSYPSSSSSSSTSAAITPCNTKNISFEDVIGNEEAKQALYENVVLPLTISDEIKLRIFSGGICIYAYMQYVMIMRYSFHSFLFILFIDTKYHSI